MALVLPWQRLIVSYLNILIMLPYFLLTLFILFKVAIYSAKGLHFRATLQRMVAPCHSSSH